MKSAYEIAMERLNKTSPSFKPTEDQKKRLAELDSVYAAKVAEREIFLNGEIEKSAAKGDYETLEHLKKQLKADRNNLAADLEEKKEKIRSEGKA
jgi:hypothetical protein